MPKSSERLSGRALKTPRGALANAGSMDLPHLRTWVPVRNAQLQTLISHPSVLRTYSNVVSRGPARDHAKQGALTRLTLLFKAHPPHTAALLAPRLRCQL